MATERHVSYPHTPGYLYDCPACESRCHCEPGSAECVYEGQHNGSGPFYRRRDGIAYLMHDGNLAVPCSRYGRDSQDCAPVAWRVAYLVNRETGDGMPITKDQLDHAMSLVVNDHDDVAYMVNAYGHGHYR